MLHIAEKMDLQRGGKLNALIDVNIYYKWKNVKNSYKNNKFKISVPAWDTEFEPHDGSNSVTDIKDYFEYIIKKHDTLTDKAPIQICVCKIQNKIKFKIKIWVLT